jgi:hypothetical protein
MSVVDLSRARTRRLPSGDLEIATPERRVRLHLPDNPTALQFLTAVYSHPRMPMHVRLEAATAALPYQSPKLIAVIANNSSSGEQVIRIVGGLPKLPGTATQFPAAVPPHAGDPATPIAHEKEVGTCTVPAA